MSRVSRGSVDRGASTLSRPWRRRHGDVRSRRHFYDNVEVRKLKEIHAESAPSVFWTTFFWQPSDAQASYQSFSLLTKLRVAATPI
jgi:hypothetical protein